MTQLLFVDAFNDPRNTHDFTNPDAALVAGVPYATAGSFASGGTTHRGIVFDLGEDKLVESVTMYLNEAGTWGWAGWSLKQGATEAAPTTWFDIAGTEVGSGSVRTWDFAAQQTIRYFAVADVQSGLAFRGWLEVDGAYADGDVVPTPPPPEPLPAIHVEIDGVEFVGLREQTIRVALNDAGSFFFAINRADDQATEENIYRGALVQVTIPQIHDAVLWEGIIESGDFDVCR